MTPLGFSGGSHDKLRVSEVERIRWTVGTAEGAGGGHQRGHFIITLLLETYFASQGLLQLARFSLLKSGTIPGKIIIIQNSPS